MERLQENRPAGISNESLRAWGAIFLAAGILGRGVIQTHLLGIGGMSMTQMLERISASQEMMTLATISLVLQAVETCAAPIFSLLLVEGIQHTADWKKYLLRLIGLALLCELPYNLAMDGRLLAMESRNPVFALVLSLVMLCFYRHYSEKSLKNTAIKLIVALAAVLWGQMLGIDGGSPVVLMTAALWLMRKKPMYRSYVGAAVAVICTVFSPFYLATPMGFLVVHMYNGEQEPDKRWTRYAIYPAMLLLAAAAGILL